MTQPRVIAIDQVEQAAAARLGCAYFSTYRAMAEDGGFTAWGFDGGPCAAYD